MNDPQPPHRRIRSTLAVIAGMLVIVIFSTATDFAFGEVGIAPDVDKLWPDSLLLIATAYRIVYSIAGCYLAARLAPVRPMQHALILGAIGFVASLAGAIAMRGLGPAWYSIALVAIALPCAWVGGRLYGARNQKHAV